MTHWSDDELMRDLKGALQAKDAVTQRSREAARAAFTWRNVDDELAELLTLAHDSDTVDAVLVRSATATEPRFLAFEGEDLGLEVEVSGDEVVGQVVPAGECEVVLRSADGGAATARTDRAGFFTLSGVPTGTVRFEVTVDGVTRPTAWLRL